MEVLICRTRRGRLNESLDKVTNLAYIAARMHSLKKSWLLAIAICVAMVAAFHSEHALDWLAEAETECCSSASSSHESHGDDAQSGHECCQSAAAVLVLVEMVVPLARVASLESPDHSFNGGMVKEIDYPPQLV